MTGILAMLPLFIAPFILCMFSLVTAYVLKFGLKGSVIHADYMIFVVYILILLLRTGVL